jgi:hypothetical protein
LDLDRVRDHATTRRRLYKASGGAAADFWRTKTHHVTPTNNTKGKKRGRRRSIIWGKKRGKNVSYFFPNTKFVSF